MELLGLFQEFKKFKFTAPVPILHYYGLEDYTTAKKTLISALLLKEDKVERRGVSEGYLSAEEADNPCAVSWREITEGSASFWTISPSKPWKKMAYINAAPDKKSTTAVLENLLASNSSAQAKFPLFRL